ncbi:MAG: hypothetical protein ACFFD4_07660 [Candidatus Odinarchaeota archaeon]
MLLKDRARRSVGGKFTVRGGTVSIGTAGVNLYESITNEELRTDKDFYTAGSAITVGGIRTKQATGAVAVASLDNNGDIQIQNCGGTARIIFKSLGTTYFVDGS